MPNILKHNFAIVSWYKEHPMRHSMGKPVQIWSKDLMMYTHIYLLTIYVFNAVFILLLSSHTLMRKSLLLYHLFNNIIPCLLPFSLQ